MAETKIQRIWLHLLCPCNNWRQARFHLKGILREVGEWLHPPDEERDASVDARM